MNAELLFQSKYLKAALLGGRRHTLRIVELKPRVKLQMVGGKTEVKPVLFFAKVAEDGSLSPVPKGLVLNKTNAQSIIANHGPETDDWVGKDVTLYSTKVPFGDRIVSAIRIEEPEPEVAEDLLGDGLGEGEPLSEEEVPAEVIENGDEGDLLA